MMAATAQQGNAEAAGSVPFLEATTTSNSNDKLNEEIMSPQAALLQLTKDASGVSEIPADITQSMLISIESMKQEAPLQKSEDPTPIAKIAFLEGDALVARNLATSLQQDMPTAQLDPCMAFGYFPRLPFELRTMIWERCLASPRVIGYHFDDEVALPGEGATHSTFKGGNSALLLACKESRVQALKVLVEFKLDHSLFPVRDSHTKYYNPGVDVLWGMTSRGVGGLLGIPIIYDLEHCFTTIPRCETLALMWDEWFGWSVRRKIQEWIWDVLVLFNCRKLILVIGDESILERSDVVLVKPMLQHVHETIDLQNRPDLTGTLAGNWAHLRCVNVCEYEDCWAYVEKAAGEELEEFRSTHAAQLWEDLQNGTADDGLARASHEKCLAWQIPKIEFRLASTVEEQEDLAEFDALISHHLTTIWMGRDRGG